MRRLAVLLMMILLGVAAFFAYRMVADDEGVDLEGDSRGVADAPARPEARRGLDAGVAANVEDPAAGGAAGPGKVEVDPTPLCLVRGRLMGDGRGLAGTTVHLDVEMVPGLRREGKPVNMRLEATTDGEGYYVFTSAPQRCRINVSAKPAEFETGRSSRIVVDETEVDLGVLVCEAGATIEGRVLGHDGGPVVGAEIQVAPIAPPSSSPGIFQLLGAIDPENARTTTTDGEGRYRVGGLAPGRARIVARAEGHPGGSQEVAGLNRGETLRAPDLVLAAPRGIEGRVLGPNGSPVAGARVRARSAEFGLEDMFGGMAEGLTSESDAEGRFSIQGLPQKALFVSVEAPGYLRINDQTVAREENNVVLNLVPGPLVFGRLTGKDGLPVSAPVIEIEGGAIVRFRGKKDAPPMRVVWGEEAARLAGEGVTATDDLFAVVDLQSTSFMLSFGAKGFGRKVESLSMLEPGAHRRLDVTLEPELVFAGRVVDAESGDPIAGAVISLSPMTSGTRTNLDETAFILQAAIDDRNGAMTPGGGRRVEKTDADGRFEIHQLVSGSYRYSARHPRYSVGVPENIKLESSLDDVVLRLELGGAITGKVTTPEGEPVISARVFVKKKQDMDPNGGPSRLGFGGFAEIAAETRSDERGEYRLEGLESGPYKLLVDPPEGKKSANGFFGEFRAVGLGQPDESGMDCQVEKGRTLHQDLVLEPPGVLTGRVTGNGQAIENAEVRLSKKGQNPGPFGGKRGMTDVKGEYRIEKLDGGAYDVSVRAPGATVPWQGEVQITSGEERRFDIALSVGGIRGRVIDAVTNDPIAGASVRIESARAEAAGAGRGNDDAGEFAILLTDAITSGGSAGARFIAGAPSINRTVVTDLDGRFEFNWLAGGDYRLWATEPDHIDGAGAVVAVVDGRYTKDIDLRLQRGGAVAVTCNRDLAEGESLKVEFFADGLSPVKTLQLVPGSNERARGLVPGDYRVVATSPGMAPVEQSISVAAGAVVDLNF